MNNLTKDPIAFMSVASIGLMALVLVWQITKIFFKKAEKLSAVDQMKLAQKFLDELVLDPPQIDLDTGKVSLSMHLMAGDDTELYRVESKPTYSLEDCTTAYFPENVLAQRMMESWYTMRDEIDCSHAELTHLGCPEFDEDGETLGLSERITLVSLNGDFSETDWDLPVELEHLENQMETLLDRVDDLVLSIEDVGYTGDLLEGIAKSLADFRESLTPSNKGTSAETSSSVVIADDTEPETLNDRLERQLVEGNISVEDVSLMWEEAPVVSNDTTPYTQAHPSKPVRSPHTTPEVFQINLKQLKRITQILKHHGLEDKGISLDEAIKRVLDHQDSAAKCQKKLLDTLLKEDGDQENLLAQVLVDVPQDTNLSKKIQILVDRYKILQDEVKDTVSCFDCGLSERLNTLIEGESLSIEFEKGVPTDAKVKTLIQWYKDQLSVCHGLIQKADDLHYAAEEALDKGVQVMDSGIDPNLGTLAENITKMVDFHQSEVQKLRRGNQDNQDKIQNLTQVKDTLQEKLVASETVREYHLERIKELQNRNPQATGGDYLKWKKDLEGRIVRNPLGLKGEVTPEIAQEINNTVADAIEMIYDEVKDNSSLGIWENRFDFVIKKKEAVLDRIRKGNINK